MQKNHGHIIVSLLACVWASVAASGPAFGEDRTSKNQKADAKIFCVTLYQALESVRLGNRDTRWQVRCFKSDRREVAVQYLGTAPRSPSVNIAGDDVADATPANVSPAAIQGIGYKEYSGTARWTHAFSAFFSPEDVSGTGPFFFYQIKPFLRDGISQLESMLDAGAVRFAIRSFDGQFFELKAADAIRRITDGTSHVERVDRDLLRHAFLNILKQADPEDLPLIGVISDKPIDGVKSRPIKVLGLQSPDRVFGVITAQSSDKQSPKEAPIDRIIPR